MTTQEHNDDDIDIDGDGDDNVSSPTPGPGHLSTGPDGPPPARARTLRDLVAAGDVTRNIEGPLEIIISAKGKAKEVERVLTLPTFSDTTAAELEAAIVAATSSGDKDKIISLLTQKLQLQPYSSFPISNPSQQQPSSSSLSQSAPTCRICLEGYTDPTTSVACWHVFCNECWLRCLGSTKLCPICKHISSASQLRRVYL